MAKMTRRAALAVLATGDRPFRCGIPAAQHHRHARTATRMDQEWAACRTPT